MWFEAIVSKTQREQACRTSPGCVCASAVRSGDEYGALRWRSFQNLLKLSGINQRNIAGNDQRAVHAARLTPSGCHLDRIGLAMICMVGNDLEFKSPSKLKGKRIAGDDSNLTPVLPRTQGFQHVQKHSLSKLGTRRLIEHRREPLLGVGQTLNGNKDHDGSAARAVSALSSARTVRANLVLSSAVRIMVFVQCTRSPGRSNFLAASRSRTSAIKISRKSS